MARHVQPRGEGDPVASTKGTKAPEVPIDESAKPDNDGNFERREDQIPEEPASIDKAQRDKPTAPDVEAEAEAEVATIPEHLKTKTFKVVQAPSRVYYGGQIVTFAVGKEVTNATHNLEHLRSLGVVLQAVDE